MCAAVVGRFSVRHLLEFAAQPSCRCAAFAESALLIATHYIVMVVLNYACSRFMHPAAPESHQVRPQHAEALLANCRHLTLSVAGPCGHDFCEPCYKGCVATQSRRATHAVNAAAGRYRMTAHSPLQPISLSIRMLQAKVPIVSRSAVTYRAWRLQVSAAVPFCRYC